MSFRFFMPTTNLMGAGSLQELPQEIQCRNLKKCLIVTDKPLIQCGLLAKLTNILDQAAIDYDVFDETIPNPTDDNVHAGVAKISKLNADFVISFGGGSVHDCAKGIALVATNGGSICDYEGVDQSKNAQLPLIAINTTSGTASEMTRFCIITDTKRHIKMAIVDWHTTPILSINDPELMKYMPASLTAATGMDALTHAVEAYVSTIATPVTDSCAIKAIELIGVSLEKAVTVGDDLHAREQMTYAQFLAGMAFNSASLGYVHAMAHQLGGFYNLPHGVCNALLLPYVCQYNLSTSPKKFKDIAVALGATNGDPIQAIQKLSSSVAIPSGLKELNVKPEDFETLAKNALKDVCGYTNPKQATLEDIIQIYQNAYNPS